jgi:predicted regulator of Ras-like GTPase activity (Roadblock/LC7/MglB family)
VDEVAEICAQLLRDSNALSIALLDKNGETIAQAGAPVDLHAISARFAGAAMATLLADRELSVRGGGSVERETSTHVALVADRALLVVLFDFRSSLGLVRLRSKKAVEELGRAFDRGPSGGPPPAAAALGKRV